MKAVKRTTKARQSPPGALELLSARERETLGLVALGYTNAEISNRLKISPKTVENHRKQVMTKLGLGSRAALVRFAFEHGLLSTGPGGAFFKSCSACRVLWHLCGEFLSDREVRFLGYQAAPAANHAGRWLFNHDRCGTKLSLALESFQSLTGESVLADSCRGTQPEHCLKAGTCQTCPIQCVCAFVGRMSHIIRHWPKKFVHKSGFYPNSGLAGGG